MTSQNAVTMNTTMNIVSFGNPIIEIVIMIGAILVIAYLMTGFVRSGFG
jgi:hypothetical protein